MLREIEAYAALTFPRWFSNVPALTSYRPVWSRFYLECQLCHEPVLNDKNWQRGHWQHHIITGDIALGRK